MLTCNEPKLKTITIDKCLKFKSSKCCLYNDSDQCQIDTRKTEWANLVHLWTNISLHKSSRNFWSKLKTDQWKVFIFYDNKKRTILPFQIFFLWLKFVVVVLLQLLVFGSIFF